MAEIDYGINLNPVSAVDSILDFSGNKRRAEEQRARDNARADRYERREVLDRLWNQQQYFESLRRDDSKLQRLVKDANAAGISPMAALGGPGAAPTNISIPGQGGRAGGTYISKPYFDQNINKITEMSAMLNLAHTAKQIKKVDAEADAIKTSVTPKTQTNFVERPEEEVIRTTKYHDTGVRPSATSYNLEGAQIEGPSQEWPDLDQWITWWIANSITKIGQDINQGRGNKKLTRRGYR